jgi:hypothetical protein
MLKSTNPPIPKRAEGRELVRNSLKGTVAEPFTTNAGKAQVGICLDLLRLLRNGNSRGVAETPRWVALPGDNVALTLAIMACSSKRLPMALPEADVAMHRQ